MCSITVAITYGFVLSSYSLYFFAAKSTSQEGLGSSSSITQDSPTLSATAIEQLGFGQEDFIGRITDLVAKRIAQGQTLSSAPIDPNWRNYDNVQPTVTSEIVIPKTNPPPHFDNVIHQNDLNDRFDENSLLKKVPKPYKKKQQHCSKFLILDLKRSPGIHLATFI